MAYASVSFAAALLATSTACAMSVPPAAPDWCRVVGGDKLPADSGGAKALCAAIGRAVAQGAAPASFVVTISVSGPSRLAAVVTLADGRTLPSLRLAQVDRPISKATIDRFGAAIAEQIAGARPQVTE